jgi:hypothetical protein
VPDISGTFRSTRETGSLAFSPLRSRGTEGSNPAPSSGESANFGSLEVDRPADVAKVFRRRSGRRVQAGLTNGHDYSPTDGLQRAAREREKCWSKVWEAAIAEPASFLVSPLEERDPNAIGR